ncbi:serine/threonine-protein phosphatase 7 [Hordeum vulgare]|nr:serine/threonine-protein phosphatase 7 [Hordeum vulgare]
MPPPVRECERRVASVRFITRCQIQLFKTVGIIPQPYSIHIIPIRTVSPSPSTSSLRSGVISTLSDGVMVRMKIITYVVLKSEHRYQIEQLVRAKRADRIAIGLPSDSTETEKEEDEDEELTPLKIQFHGASSVMQYDERYTPYIEMTGLLPFIQLVSRSTPNLNAAAVTTLIDRWRPETHSFHLRTREMTVTLQDVSMITALPIKGKPLCMSTYSEGWRQQMEALIGMSPQEPEVEDGGKKDRVLAGAPFTWIAANFSHCPKDADDEVIQSWTMLVAGPQRTVELVVVCSYFQYGAGNAYLLDALKAQSGIPGMTTTTLYGFLHGLTSGTWWNGSHMVPGQTLRKEVKKQADESEDILEKTPGGKKGESALRLFIKEQGKKLRRLSNILGCRDPEYVSPLRSGSSERNTLDDSASSGARMDDGDITSAANTQRNTVEDDVDTPEVADGMTLKAFQRSAYMLKPRKEFRRYSPDDYAKGMNNFVWPIMRNRIFIQPHLEFKECFEL